MRSPFFLVVLSHKRESERQHSLWTEAGVDGLQLPKRPNQKPCHYGENKGEGDLQDDQVTRPSPPDGTCPHRGGHFSQRFGRSDPRRLHRRAEAEEKARKQTQAGGEEQYGRVESDFA